MFLCITLSYFCITVFNFFLIRYANKTKSLGLRCYYKIAQVHPNDIESYKIVAFMFSSFGFHIKMEHIF